MTEAIDATPPSNSVVTEAMIRAGELAALKWHEYPTVRPTRVEAIYLAMQSASTTGSDELVARLERAAEHIEWCAALPEDLEAVVAIREAAQAINRAIATPDLSGGEVERVRDAILATSRDTCGLKNLGTIGGVLSWDQAESAAKNAIAAMSTPDTDRVAVLTEALERIQDEANTVGPDWRETASMIDSICIAALLLSRSGFARQDRRRARAALNQVGVAALSQPPGPEEIGHG